MTNTPRGPLPAPLTQSRVLRDFLAAEVGGAVVLVVATVAALAWANSPWQAGYHGLWGTELTLSLGRWDLGLNLREWVNEGLMSLFFLVVGLEVKREFLHGELSGARRAALPIIAALGGMALPAALYALVNIGAGGAAPDGWAIPMATDIAFALGVLALVAPGLPPSLRVFLLALAIVDDIGAVVVIAVVYSGGIEPEWLAAAGAALVVVYAVRRTRLSFWPVFVPLGAAAWLFLHIAGVSPTLAGVAMGLLVPGTDRLERLLHPWTSLLVVPLFALANAGVRLSAGVVGHAVTSSVTLGVVVGLVAGKALGITGASWLACRAGLTELPSGSSWRDLTGVANVAGIGFTVSLFITELAFGTSPQAAEAKVGIFTATVAASLLAAVVLRAGRRRRTAD